MNKHALILLLFIAGSVGAASNQVLVLKLNYDNGGISLVNKTLKYGFYPDRNYQPENGYTLEIISNHDDVLYDFTFRQPNIMYVDGTVNETLTGGIVAMDNVDFSLVVPYFEEAKEIRIYSPEDDLLMKEVVHKKDMSRKFTAKGGVFFFDPGFNK